MAVTGFVFEATQAAHGSRSTGCIYIIPGETIIASSMCRRNSVSTIPNPVIVLVTTLDDRSGGSNPLFASRFYPRRFTTLPTPLNPLKTLEN